VLKTVSTEENKRVAGRAFEEIMNQGNLEVTSELVADDYKLNEPQGLPAGVEGMRMLAKMYRAGFPDLHMTVEDMIGEGDLVAVRWSGTGTHRGEFMGFPPTGQKVQVRGISWLRFRDGKIAEEWTQISR